MVKRRVVPSSRRMTSLFPSVHSSPLLYLAILLVRPPQYSSKVNESPTLFEPIPEVLVLGPSIFPKPTHVLKDIAVVPIVKPAFGHHRASSDAIFAYAEGYSLSNYMIFIETLRGTGFDGDLVLAVAEKPLVRPGVMEYLKTQSNLVVYHSNLTCFDSDQGTVVPRHVNKITGNFDGYQMCCLHNVYGVVDENGEVVKEAQDPRRGRAVATIRYEWYWIWNQHYDNNVWIMLLDARDSYFQTNPFRHLPRFENKNTERGQLWFFAENSNATRLGNSTHNVDWLRKGYGNSVVDAVRTKPIICSGSTLGESVALEQYLRALINEMDETSVVVTGSDQGFHNYLYYSRKLLNVRAISSLKVWKQGHGLINNLGALRNRPLAKVGIYNETTHEVSNVDGSLSAVVHQWDRDQDLHRFIFRNRFRHLKKEWERGQRGSRR